MLTSEEIASAQSLGNIIKQKRKEYSMTQLALATKCNVTSQYIHQIENGLKTNPSFELLVNLAESLEISLEELQPGINELIIRAYNNICNY